MIKRMDSLSSITSQFASNINYHNQTTENDKSKERKISVINALGWGGLKCKEE